MEFRKLCGLSHERFLAYLFPKLILVQESDIWRDEDESEEE